MYIWNASQADNSKPTPHKKQKSGFSSQDARGPSSSATPALIKHETFSTARFLIRRARRQKQNSRAPTWSEANGADWHIILVAIGSGHRIDAHPFRGA